MDSDSGARLIARSIILAAIIAVGVPLVWGHVQSTRAERAAAAALAALNAQMEEFRRAGAVADRQRRAAATFARSTATPTGAYGRRPHAGESCVSGYLVRRIKPPAKGWEQVLYRGQPVRC
ncbi:MAG: hypothetical protein J0H15_01410 [Xanthomonadales bacterium]|nr:hypothetical protein [Xanthomonadales bacterium]